jgi:hypothetical protein
MRHTIQDFCSLLKRAGHCTINYLSEKQAVWFSETRITFSGMQYRNLTMA